MIKITIDQQNNVALFEPSGELTEQDFKHATKTLDPHIQKTGKLNGLIIHTEHLPGWESFGSLTSHLCFIKQHHTTIKSIAFVTHSPLANLIEIFAQHLVCTEIKNFD